MQKALRVRQVSARHEMIVVHAIPVAQEQVNTLSIRSAPLIRTSLVVKVRPRKVRVKVVAIMRLS
jgi:hypothetical protein